MSFLTARGKKQTILEPIIIIMYKNIGWTRNYFFPPLNTVEN